MPINSAPVHPPATWQSISLTVANRQGKHNVLFIEIYYIIFAFEKQYLGESTETNKVTKGGIGGCKINFSVIG